MKMLNPTVLAEILDARFAADIAEANISGASAAVLQGGELLYKKSHGAAKEIDRKQLSTAAGRIGTITWREMNV